MELEEGEILEYYPDNPKAKESSDLHNTVVENDKLKHIELETNLIRVLMNSYGLSPDQSSTVDKFALELESLLLESSDLNANKDSEGFKGENSYQSNDNESGGSLVILLNEADDDHADSKVQNFEEEKNAELSILEEGVCREKSPVVTGVSSGQIVRPISIIKPGEDSTSSPILHSHLRVFDIDIDNLEEKKWRCSNVDLSHFFNYDFDEEKWKDYCIQMEKLRSKRVVKNKLVPDGESRKINDQRLASKEIAKTVFEEPKHAKTESFAEGFKTQISPSTIRMFCDSAVIIQIIVDDNQESTNEESELLDRGSRSRTVHKNINGGQIVPFPLDGYSHCMDHQESLKAEQSSLLRQQFEDAKRINISHYKRTSSYKVKNEFCKQWNSAMKVNHMKCNMKERYSRSDSIVLVNDCVDDPNIRPNLKRKWIYIYR